MKKLLIRKRRSKSFKIDLKMKLTLLLFFTAFLNLWANDSYSQKTKITIDVENASIDKIIDEIESSTEFRFVYNVKDVNLDRKVSVRVKKEKIEKLLDKIFSGTLTSYKVRGKQIILIKKQAKEPGHSYSNRLQQTVSGKVTNAAGLPLTGVTVMVKTANIGVATNFDGDYQISVDPQGVLIFSYLGYKKMEVPVEGRTEINVQMVEDVTALGEVQINAGYYHTTKRESTGNISRVTTEEIENQPVVSPLIALQGRMAGVEIIPGGDQPGMAPKIRIRGRNSLREEGNLPLYIIDGVPINATSIESNSLLGSTGIDPLSTLNLSDILSIEVLKDADATAIYGSRGANGVVLITTKNGRYGNEGLQVNFYTGESWMPNRLNLLNTEQYLQIRRKAFENDGIEPTVANAVDLVVWDQERYTDWQDLIFGGTSAIQDFNVSTSAASETTSFRLGGSYHEQGSIYPGDLDYQKLTAALSLNHISENKKLEMDLSVNYGHDNISSIGQISLASHAFSLPPNAPPIFNDDGSLHWEGWSEAGWDNPFSGFFDTSSTKSDNLISNLGLSYNIIEGLSLKSSFGYTHFNSGEIIKMPQRSYNPASWENLDHTSLHMDNSRRSWIVEPQIEFSRTFNQLGLDVLLGGTVQESDFNLTSLQADGYVAESLIGNLSAAERLLNGRSMDSKISLCCHFRKNRIGQWDRKIFLNLTGRRDGSSRFGPGKKLAEILVP